MAVRHASWRVFLPAVVLFTLAVVPPLVSLSLWLCGAIRDDVDLNFEMRWGFLVSLPCVMLGAPVLLGGLFAFFFPKSRAD
jgi:hypothetical protein